MTAARIKSWVVWSLILAIGGYCLLLLLHSALTVERFKNVNSSSIERNWPPEDALAPGGDGAHLFWFVQLSDIHVSRFWDAGRQSDLRRFCVDWLPVIRPKVVLVTGDLTDAKDVRLVGSEQYVEEWKNYYEAVADSPAIQSGMTSWLDLRGNHDTFDVPSFDHPRNYYRRFSIRGRLNLTSYVHHVHVDGAKYSFIGADFSPSPGPKRPYNFFGILDDEKIEEIEGLQRETKNSNATIYFGHYPTSTVVSVGRKDVLDLMRDGLAYLSGHLHTAYGHLPAMHAIQASGTLELEAGDWKDGRRLRLVALDHGLMSFTDQSFASDFPLVVLTNPKHALYLTPTKEPLHRILASTHVRILAFSDVAISTVTVYIDDAFIGEASQPDPNSPLFVLPWNPRSFSPGTHTIEVRVTDAKARFRMLKQPFSTHGHSHLEFRFLNRLLLLSDISVILKTIFFLLFSSLFGPLFFFRFRPSAYSSCHSWVGGSFLPLRRCSSACFSSPPPPSAARCSNSSSAGISFSSPSSSSSSSTRPSCPHLGTCAFTASSCSSSSCSCSSSSCPPSLPRPPFPMNIPAKVVVFLFRSLFFISLSNCSFFAVAGILVYMLIGPWFIAYVTSDQLGFVFLHGICVQGRFLPMNTTYGSGIGHLLFFLLPFCVHLGRCLEFRFRTLVRKSRSSSPASSSAGSSAWWRRYSRLVFFRIFAPHWFSLAFFGYHFYSLFRPSPYGFWQVALAPVKTWFFFVAAALTWRAKAASMSAFRKEALEYGLVDSTWPIENVGHVASAKAAQ